MSNSPSAPPNIILINCDDLGYGDLGCYGSQVNSTPHIDRLAAEGMRFTDFYAASPVCSASRAAMLTGCYSQRIGFGGCEVLFPGQAEGLHPRETTIARQLKKAGYNTKIIGKWHCGDQPEFLPSNHGFDEYFGIPYSNDMGRQVGRLEMPPLPLMVNDCVLQQQPDQRGITERYVDESLRFLRQQQDAPFFLYLAHMYVHVPLFVPRQFLDRSRNGAYGAAVGCIDWAMGMIEAELEKLGLKENTLVIFTSDNGSRASGDGGSNGPLRGIKAQTWEGGQRVPCIARWPGQISAGSTASGIASSIDFFATFSELAHTTLPEEIHLDSISLTPTLRHGKPTGRDRFAFYRRGNLEALRAGKWKLHFWKEQWAQMTDSPSPHGLLYNLEDDPGETTDLSSQHPEVVQEIENAASILRQQLGDKRLSIKGSEIRPCGKTKHPRPLTTFDENHPYMIACYDLADMPTMIG